MTWRRQLDGLADEFTVVAWDAPGAGRSTDPPEPFGLDGYADCLAGFLEKLGFGTACVAGLSFGGIVALALQRRHSARSSALILASAYAGWAGSLPPEVAEQRLRQALALADGTPEGFVAALLPTMFPRRCRVRRWTTSAPACRRSIRVGFGLWRRRLPRTSATCCPALTSRRCWCTATGMCEPPDCRRGPARSDLRFEARRRAGRGPSLQHRSSGRVERGGPELFPRESSLDHGRGAARAFA
jgi:pimeloyl-ACP methyl ester carboxylesterase